MKLNKKGMTLIEIVVVLVISSLVLVVAGTVILNGFGYFDKTDRADKDKLAVDKIAELVRDQLVYTSDVVIDTKDKENSYNLDKGWHYISLVDGEIHKDGTALYSEDYYQNRTLKLEARLYQNDYRMDLKFYFHDSSGKQVYKTTLTLELINLKSKVVTNSTNDLTNITDSEPNEYRIYYKSDFRSIKGDDPGIPPEPYEPTGTVADEVFCKDDLVTLPGDSSSNNKGVWKYYATGTVEYKNGDFVQYPDETGDWYRLTIDNISNGITPNSTWEWKQLNPEWQLNSLYQPYDVVIFEGKYYKVKETGTTFSPKQHSGSWFSPFSTSYEAIHHANKLPSYFENCPIKSSKTCTGTIADKYYYKTTENDKGRYNAFFTENDINKEKPQANSSLSGKIKTGDFMIFDMIEEYDMYTYSYKWKKTEDSWYIALSDQSGDFLPGTFASLYWQRITSVKDAGSGKLATFDSINLYFTVSYYQNVLRDPTHQFFHTGDIVYSETTKKYYGANYNANSIGYGPEEQDGRYWKVLDDKQIENSKEQCELNRNK